MATEIMRDRSNLVINIVVAVAGAFLAGFFLSPIFKVGTINDAITVPTMLVTLLGSVILLVVNPKRTRARTSAFRALIVATSRIKSGSQQGWLSTEDTHEGEKNEHTHLSHHGRKRRSNQLAKVDLVRERSISLLQSRYGYTKEKDISGLNK